MNDRILEDQHELVELLEAAGWDVTDAELSVYESPWENEEVPEASVTLSARKRYPEEEGDDGDDGDDESPYRIS
ncbi:hypothetical protein [Halalkalicoccus jeotgali]|uniref:Uncharacterized protein n=1 Tax=Halalkalicoccus jeotgali (strain DSM 18796 / CECT 7217 / JCM 14584 / KCTC 4019 / B3) TaxID=795797 RepID=D8J294_HALJB|nr:hypothetical protein [Halalkalicoccus jeotgali]ADJ14851.1 hypothetical protein HacjB3_07330 [Halalkalicoccus jeotgali B3]ELY39433.1 hypothetical protein C497_05737 [Halalkalicoccus jeotgali B3]